MKPLMNLPAGLIKSFALSFFMSITIATNAQIAKQPSQAEIDKMMKQANDMMKKYGKDSTVNKAMKDAQDQQKEMMDKMKKNPSVKNSTLSLDKNDTAQYALPSRNTKLLNALPIRTFNRAELISYIYNLNTKLTAHLRNAYATDIDNIPAKAIAQPGTAIGLWLKGNIKESVLVAVQTAELKPDNNLVLNNTGGMLTNCGLGFYAIPILEYVLEKQPKNNLILNNLGQAYLDLGDDKKAEQYLLQCIKSYKYYPDANLALAYIYNSRGQKSNAINYAENSLRGAWSEKAHEFLRKLKPDLKMMDYVRHRYKQPEYFDIRDYPMLEQCTNTATVYSLRPHYLAYYSMIHQAWEKYTALFSPAAHSAINSIPEKMMAANKTKRNPYRPFSSFGMVVLDALKTEYEEKFKRLDSFRKSYYQQREQLNAKYEAECEQMDRRHEKTERLSDETRCKEMDALSNSFLPLYAEPTEMLQRKTLAYYKDYLNDMAYWSYIASINDDEFHVSFYRLVLEFLGRLKEINTTRFIESGYSGRFYPCKYRESGTMKADSINIELPDCWINPKIEADLGVFKLEISCETYQLEAGEGFVGKIEYSRTNGDVTLAFGIGGNLPGVFFKSPLGEIGGDAEAKSQGYMTFNNQGTPTDFGILWEAELKAGIDIGGITATIGEEENFTAGFGSGLQAKEGGLIKRAVDALYPVQPDDKQTDKRVPLYKK